MNLLETLIGTRDEPSLAGLLAALPRFPDDRRFGPDIDEAHRVLLDPSADPAAREAGLRRWLARHQPCLFGRLAARQDAGPAVSKGVGFDLVLLGDEDLDRGEEHLAATIQAGRRAWKLRAARGESSALLIYVNSARLALARPSPELREVCRRLAELYLIESGRVDCDVVYTEAVPLRHQDGRLYLYKASTQLFYTGAHLMRNHDRRVPGGVLISMNGPGHLARSLALRGLHDDYEAAVAFVGETAMRSIGNGGLGHPAGLSSSWHNPVAAPADGAEHPGRCPEPPSTSSPSPSRRAALEAADHNQFSAVYQIDVLVQSDVIADDEPRLDRHRPQDVWGALHLEYISSAPTTSDDPDHGWFNGIAVDDSALYHNPWLPRRAENTPEFNY
jgi:hypothetical protein